MAPTKEQWSAYKDTITELFLNSTLADTKERMEVEYGFVASKTQYERYLRKWKCRKNVKDSTDQEWFYILQTRFRRQKQGKNSKVTLYGNPVSEATIRKRESRYTLSKLQEMHSCIEGDSDPPCPEGILITTPEAFRASISRSPSREPFPDAQRSMFTRNEGSVEFPYLQEQYFSSEMVIYTGTQPIRNTWVRNININNLPYFHYLDFITSSDLKIDSSSLYSTNAIDVSLSRSDIELFFDEVDGHEYELFWEQHSPSHSVIPAAPLFSDNVILHYLPGEAISSVPRTKAEIQKMLRAQPGSSMLEREAGDLSRRLERLFGPSDVDSLKEFFNFVVFSISNCLTAHLNKDILLNWLLEQGKLILRDIMKLRLPTMRAYLQSMVHDTIMQGKLRAGQDLIEADTENNLFLHHPEQRLSAAVALGSVELVRELVWEMIVTGTNINGSPYSRTFVDERDIWNPVKPVTILGAATSVEVAEVLLEAGADVNALHFQTYGIRDTLSPLQRAVRMRNPKLVRLLLRYNADIHQKGSENELLYYALASGIPDLVNALRKGGAYSNLLNSLDMYRRLDDDSKLPLPLAEDLINLSKTWYASKACNLERGSNFTLVNAARNGYLELVHQLLLAGVDANAPTRITWDRFFEKDSWCGNRVEIYPHTALVAAVEGNHIDIVKLLLRNKANVNELIFTTYGCSALEAAQNLGHREIVDCLINYGAITSPLRSAEEQVLELQIAAVKNDVIRAQALVNVGVDPASILDVLSPYICNHAQESVQDLLDLVMAISGGKLNLKSPLKALTLLEAFIRVQDYATAQKMIRDGAIIHDHAKILKVITHGLHQKLNDKEKKAKLDLMKALAEVSVEPQIYLEHIMHCAVIDMDQQTIEYSILKGLNINAGQDIVLGLALQQSSDGSHQSFIQQLISLGADVNATDKEGYSPLMRAAESSVSLEIFRILFGAGAQINAVPGTNRTVLQEAAFSGNPSCDIIECLLEAGADINAPPGEFRGFTALQGAAMKGHLRIALILLEHGADPNAPGAKWEGRTALEGAAEQGHLDMVQLLLNAGASSIENAANLAENENHQVIADLLREKLTS